MRISVRFSSAVLLLLAAVAAVFGQSLPNLQDTAGMGIPGVYTLSAANLTAQPFPYPPLVRSNAGETLAAIWPSRGTFANGNLFGTGTSVWTAQAAAIGAQEVYTLHNMPTWMASSGTAAPTDIDSTNEACFMTTTGVVSTTAPTSNQYTSPSGNCKWIEEMHKLMQANCGVSTIPSTPRTGTCKIHYFEGWNEFDGDGFWTDTYAHLAKLMVDANWIQQMYCGDCGFIVGSSAAGGDGYHTNGESGVYYTSIDVVLQDAHTYSVSSGKAFHPAGVSYHMYSAHTNVAPNPFPEFNQGYRGAAACTGSTSSDLAVCYCNNSAEVKAGSQPCREAMVGNPTLGTIGEGDKLRAVLVADSTLSWMDAAHIPFWNTESGFNWNRNLQVASGDMVYKTTAGATCTNGAAGCYAWTGPNTTLLEEAFVARMSILQANPLNTSNTIVNLPYEEDNQCFTTFLGKGVAPDSGSSTVAGCNYGFGANISFSGGGCTTTPAARLKDTNGAIVSATITNAGAGCTSAPSVSISGGAGSGATATATVSSGAVSAITITNGGKGYYPDPFLPAGVLPTGTAFKAVVGWLHGASFSGACGGDSTGVWSCSIAKPGGYQGLILWYAGADQQSGWLGTKSYTPGGVYGQQHDIFGTTTTYAGGALTLNNLPILLDATITYGHGRALGAHGARRR